MAQVVNLTEHVARILGNIDVAIERESTQLDELHLRKSELERILEQLKALPARVSHQVMVPYGQAAFFPGKLVHTNECMVSLGQDYVVEQSAVQAIAILERRRVKLQIDIDAAEKGVLDLKAKLADTTAALRETVGPVDDQEAEGLIDITEIYDEAVHGHGASRGIGSTGAKVVEKPGLQEDSREEALMARLSELEEEEAQADAESSSEMEFSSGSEDMFDKPAQLSYTVEEPLDVPRRSPAATVSSGTGRASTASAGGAQQAGTGKPPATPKPLRKGFFAKPSAAVAAKAPQDSLASASEARDQPAKGLQRSAAPVLMDVVERCGIGEVKGEGDLSTSHDNAGVATTAGWEGKSAAPAGAAKPKGILKKTEVAAKQELPQPKKLSRFKQQRQGLG